MSLWLSSEFGCGLLPQKQGEYSVAKLARPNSSWYGHGFEDGLRPGIFQDLAALRDGMNTEDRKGSFSTSAMMDMFLPKAQCQLWALPHATCFCVENGHFSSWNHYCHYLKHLETTTWNSSKNGKTNVKPRVESAVFLQVILQGGVRRLDATFAVAPKGQGAEEFHSWLLATRHPWADRLSAELQLELSIRNWCLE